MARAPKPIDEELRSECGHAAEDILARRSPEEFRRLRAVVAAKAPDPVELQNAINLLGRWGDPEAAPDIVALLPGLDEVGLINAVDALGRLGGTVATNAVLKQAGHESPDVRRFAVAALARLGTKRATDRLEKLARTDPAGFVRSKARAALKGGPTAR